MNALYILDSCFLIKFVSCNVHIRSYFPQADRTPHVPQTIIQFYVRMRVGIHTCARAKKRQINQEEGVCSVTAQREPEREMGSGGSKQTSGGDAAGSKKKKAKKSGKGDPTEQTAPQVARGTAATAEAPAISLNGTNTDNTEKVENGTTAVVADVTNNGGENGTTAAVAEKEQPNTATDVTLRTKKPASGANRRTSFYETVDAAEILPHLVMGNLASSRNPGFLRGKHVGFVLDLTVEGEIASSRQGSSLGEQGLEYLRVGIEDDEEEEIYGQFETCFEFINKARSRRTPPQSDHSEGKRKHHSSANTQQKTVLVHSNYGLSRTSAIVLAYLMKEKQWTLREAHGHLMKCQDTAKPNDGFVVQLLRYEQELRGTMSMTLKDFYRQP